MSFTYAQLKTAIQDFTENTETSFVTNLPVFIRAAEERVLKSVDLNNFRKNATSALTSGDEYIFVGHWRRHWFEALFLLSSACDWKNWASVRPGLGPYPWP